MNSELQRWGVEGDVDDDTIITLLRFYDEARAHRIALAMVESGRAREMRVHDLTIAVVDFRNETDVVATYRNKQ